MKPDRDRTPRQLSFSQRYGYEPLPEPMRLEHLSDDLRRELCDSTQMLIESFERDEHFYENFSDRATFFWKSVLGEFLRKTRSEIAESCEEVNKICANTIKLGEFYKVLDFFEILLKHLSSDHSEVDFANEVKTLFQKHQAAYWLNSSNRLYEFVPSTSEEQAIGIEQGLVTIRNHGQNGAATHLRQAVEHINAKQYADSILDSIHAVESVARKIDPKSSQTLGSALDSLKNAGLLRHPALIKGLNSLYGYTSDEGGIRHSLTDRSEADVEQEEAIFMFGACASFAAYLSAKHAKLGNS